jgi:hypothetical protein
MLRSSTSSSGLVWYSHHGRMAPSRLKHYACGVARDGMAPTPPPRPAWVIPALTGTLAAIALLAVLADGYFYRNTANSFVVWIVVGIVGLSWCVELAARWQPVWLLGAAQLVAVGWLAALRRADVAPLFLMVLVACVSYTRTRRQSALLLSCILGFFWLGTPTMADRAGMGWSDAASEPRDARRIAADLHMLLERADIPGPYLLVGNLAAPVEGPSPATARDRQCHLYSHI